MKSSAISALNKSGRGLARGAPEAGIWLRSRPVPKSLESSDLAGSAIVRLAPKNKNIYFHTIITSVNAKLEDTRIAWI